MEQQQPKTLVFLHSVRRIYVNWETATDIQVLETPPKRWYHFFLPPPSVKSISGRSIEYNEDLYYIREHGEGKRYRIDQQTGILYKLPNLVFEIGRYESETVRFRTEDELQAFAKDLITEAKNAGIVIVEINKK